MGVLKVAKRSVPNAVAGSLVSVVREMGTAELQTIGAGAMNQAIKAIAIARKRLDSQEIDLICRPAFAVVMLEGRERTVIRLMVESCSKGDLIAISTPDDTVSV
ncbi:MAG: stage V sporulation protein S [Patescibacteria group bacterium]|jgi:stage V sporulation protein S